MFLEPIFFHASATAPPQLGLFASPMCSSRGELLQSVPLFHNPSVFSIIRLPVPPWRSFKFGCCEEMQKVHLQFSLGGPNVRYFHFLKGT